MKFENYVTTADINKAARPGMWFAKSMFSAGTVYLVYRINPIAGYALLGGLILSAMKAKHA